MWKLGFGFLAFASFILVVFGIVLLVTNEIESYWYSGRTSFESEEAYSNFKRFLIQDGVSFSRGDILVLSSAPPIVISYSIKIPVNMNMPFPYDSKLTADTKNVGLYVPFIMFGGVVLGISLGCLLEGSDE